MAPIHDLYERYAADVYRFALYLSGEHADAEDITADTFVRLWTTPGQIRTRTVKAYLFTIARHLYLDRQRARSRFTELEDSERSDPMLQHPLALPANLERETVTRTRGVLRRRTWTLALAIWLTCLPMTYVFTERIRFLMFCDVPGSRLLWLVAALLWMDYIRQSRRLRIGR